jgi:succinate dehydrogenase / fumarate reductase flavoprotein subunit
VGNYLGELGIAEAGFSNTEDAAFEQAESEVKQRISQFMNMKGTRSPRSFHKELGQIIWNYCGMSRTEAGLNEAIDKLQKLKDEFWQNLLVVGKAEELNAELERAGRVADFIEFGELMCRDALMREESCGGHFREEFQTNEGEALRNDSDYAFVGVWEYKGEGQTPVLQKEDLAFENVALATRSYK